MAAPPTSSRPCNRMPQSKRPDSRSRRGRLPRVENSGQLIGRVFAAPRLKHELKSELNLPVMRTRCCDSASSIVVGAILKDGLHVWLTEIRVVENVEELGPEREICILLEVELLKDGEVHVHKIGADDVTSPHVPIEARNRIAQSQRVWQGERIGIEPMLRSSQPRAVCANACRWVQAPARNQIGAVCGAGA